MNLLTPDLLEDAEFDKFRSGLGAALQFIKHQHDDDMEWIRDQERMKGVDRATAEFVQTATGTELEIAEGDEVINMCRAWENSMNKARNEERNNGIKNAIAMMKELCASKDIAIQQLVKRYALSPEEAVALVNSNW